MQGKGRDGCFLSITLQEKHPIQSSFLFKITICLPAACRLGLFLSFSGCGLAGNFLAPEHRGDSVSLELQDVTALLCGSCVSSCDT